MPDIALVERLRHLTETLYECSVYSHPLHNSNLLSRTEQQENRLNIEILFAAPASKILYFLIIKIIDCTVEKIDLVFGNFRMKLIKYSSTFNVFLCDLEIWLSGILIHSEGRPRLIHKFPLLYQIILKNKKAQSPNW